MAKDVADYVQTCSTCQKFKNPQSRKIGRLHSIPSSRFFERLHIDIIGPFIHPGGTRYIITAIDAYSRFAFAQSYTDSRSDYCLDFLDHVISIHGVPSRLVSDNGSQFRGVQWADKMKKYGIKHNFTTDYHPQCNGIDEKLNGSLVKTIRNYTTEYPATWHEEIKWALFSYNTAFHESLRLSPYEVVFGCKPRTPLNLRVTDPIPAQEAREVIREVVSQNLIEAQQRQKHFYDRNRDSSSYEVGDSVLLRNNNMKKNLTHKLQPKWIGPAIILKLHKPFADRDPTCAEVLNFFPKAHVHSTAIEHMKRYYFRSKTDKHRIQLTVEDLESPEQPVPAARVEIPEANLLENETDISIDGHPEPIEVCEESDNQEAPQDERNQSLVADQSNSDSTSKTVIYHDASDEDVADYSSCHESTPARQPETEPRELSSLHLGELSFGTRQTHSLPPRISIIPRPGSDFVSGAIQAAFAPGSQES